MVIDGTLMNLVFIGGPGAGKGTQASLISNYFNLQHVAMGDIIRNEIRSGSLLGKELKTIVNVGVYPKDELILDMLKTHLLKVIEKRKGVLLDGFPRTVYQAQILDLIFNQIGLSLYLVCFLSISNMEAIKRLTGRFSCINCGKGYHNIFDKTKKEGVCDICNSINFIFRDDDKEIIAKKRLIVYYNKTLPVVKFYEKRGLLKNINAQQSINLVTKNIFNILGINKFF